jgi:hypothetical protein
MMQIHNVIEDKEMKWELDPVRGAIRVSHSIVRASDAHTISSGGKTYKVDRETGSFMVPDDLGRALVRTPGWFEGPGIPFPPTPEELEAVSTGKGKKEDSKPEAKE